MSEQIKKLVKIILPDLLNYLEMVESGEIIEKRLQKNISIINKTEKDKMRKAPYKRDMMKIKNKNTCIYYKV